MPNEDDKPTIVENHGGETVMELEKKSGAYLKATEILSNPHQTDVDPDLWEVTLEVTRAVIEVPPPP